MSAGALLVALSATTASVADATRVQLASGVDVLWRGPYDLLIRPAGARLNLESTRGLVEPNFVNYSGDGGIGMADLDAIRRIPDVGVAAPIANVGILGYVAQAPLLNIPFDVFPEEDVRLFRYDLRLITSDGLDDIVLQTQSGRVLMGPGRQLAFDQRTAQRTQESWSLAFELLPVVISPVIAVDPGAEAQLSSGIDDAFRELAAVDDEPRTAGEFDPARIPSSFGDERTYFDFYRLEGPPDRPVIPVVVSERMLSPLSLELGVEQAGTLEAWPSGANDQLILGDAERLARGPIRGLEPSVIDLQERLLPFQTPPMSLWWPDSDPVPPRSTVAGRVPTLEAIVLTRPRYQPVDCLPDAAVCYEVAPAGPRLPAHEVAAALWPSQPQQTYRETSTRELTAGEEFNPQTPMDAPFLLAPVGGFDLNDVQIAEGAANRVPLGAYDQPQTALVADSAGREVGPTAMGPGLNPAGLISVPPLAITDLGGAQALRGDRPIDAIRVRVSGISDYSAASVARVERVASRIAAMGLDVDVVAGSSPQPVSLYVPEYGFSELVTSHEFEEASVEATDLGWVEQGWSTLGAAERVTRGLGTVNATLLALGLAAAALLVIALQVTESATRAQEVAVLRAIGWSRGRIIAWVSGERVVIGSAAMAVGGISWLVTGGSPWGIATAAGIGLLTVMSGILAVLVGASRANVASVTVGDLSRSAGRRTLRPVESLSGMAWRSVSLRPGRSLPLLLTIALGATTVSLGAFAVGGALQAAGPTRLAASLSSALQPQQLAMLGLAAVASLLILLSLSRLDQAERRQEVAIQRASGWPTAALRSARRRERWLVAGGAAIVALGVTALLAAPMTMMGPAGPTFTAAVLALSFVGWAELVAPAK